MATVRTFQDMLNEYLPNQMLKEELIQRDYVIQTVNRDDNWKGGKLIVPFKSAGATSVKFGGLTGSTDVAQSKYIRGSIDDYREVWGTLIFNQRDLQEHDGKIPESTFLRLLPDELEDFMDYQKEVVSVQLGSGPHFLTATVDGTALGVLGVDHIDRCQIGQKFTLDDDDSASVDVYITDIDVNTKKITVSATRGGAALDVSAYTVAGNAKGYHDGVFDAGGSHDTFVSIRQALLSAANGGVASLHGKSKLSAPILQAYNIDGSGLTTANILTTLYDGLTEVRSVGKGMATEYLMDLPHLGAIMKLIESSKGAYRVVEGSAKESLYGWLEMKVMSITGQVIKFVGIQEWESDTIALMDWRSVTFHSNGFFKKRISPDGREYFEIRNTDGYQYLVDVCLFGEMEFKKPGHSAIFYNCPAF